MIKILKTEYKPNCYVLHSFPKMENDFNEFRVKSVVSFLYDAGEYAAEWEPQYGPIQVWYKCEKDSTNSREHYYYEYTDSSFGNWSQTAVDTHKLPEAANKGYWDYIFEVLRDWATK